MPPPAYRIHTARLVLRCWDPADAPLLREAIAENLEHLRPWMPWIQGEPETLDAKVERLRQFRANFDLGHDFIYGIFTADESRVLGGTGLHTRAGPDAREIGYWLHRDFVGRGLATETAAALTRVAFEVDQVHRVELHIDPENTPSAAIARRLGFVHEAVLRQRSRTAEGEWRDRMIWTLFRDAYPGSPAAGAEVEAFDALGRKLL